MTELYVEGISFGELVELYRRDPEAFERLRGDMLEREIAKAPEGRRDQLRAIVHGTEMRLCRFGDGLARYNAVVEMFHDELARFSGALQGRVSERFDSKHASAQIINLEDRRSDQ